MERQHSLHVQTEIEVSEPVMSNYPIGSQFKMSALGVVRSPRLADKRGTIVGTNRYSRSVRVLLDGSKSPISLHRDYIEPIPYDVHGGSPEPIEDVQSQSNGSRGSHR